jgi:hypothetical protein
VDAIETYITRTDILLDPSLRDSSPIFISLKAKPNSSYLHPLKPTSKSGILKRFIARAGLDASKFTARTLRSGGATKAKKHLDPDVLFKLGRWRNKDIFMRHYYGAEIPVNYLDNMVSLDSHTTPDNLSADDIWDLARLDHSNNELLDSEDLDKIVWDDAYTELDEV